MTDPSFNSPIDHASLQGQAAAANAAMIITGLEKELNAKKIKFDLIEPKVDLENLSQYVEKLTGITSVEKITKRKEKPEDREGALEYFIKAGASFIPSKKKRAFPFLRRANPRLIIKADETAQYPVSREIDHKAIKEYLVLFARHLTHTPPEKQPEIVRQLQALEKLFDARGLSVATLAHIKEKITNLVRLEIAEIIKDNLHKKLQHLPTLLDVILNAKSSAKLWGMLFFNEAVSNAPFTPIANDSSPDKLFKEIVNQTLPAESQEIESLLSLVQEQKIDLSDWINSWNFDKISINADGQISILSPFNPTQREIRLLLDEIKLLETRKHLETALWRRILLYFRIRQIEKVLQGLEVEHEKISEIKLAGRQIAWVKIITILKDFHLQRIFCASPSEFNNLSETIDYLTKKARKLEKKLSVQEAKLIHLGLEKLAIDTAKYKLELLESLQAIEPSAQNTKDIKWLTAVINHFVVRQQQTETIGAVKQNLQSLLKSLNSTWEKFFS